MRIKRKSRVILLVITSITTVVISNLGTNAQNMYYLYGEAPSNQNGWKEQVYSSSNSPTPLIPNPQHLYCVHYGAESISNYTTNNINAGGNGVLKYTSWSSDYVIANQSMFIDVINNATSIPNLDAWKFSAFEYLYTNLPVFSAQVYGDHSLLSPDIGVWEIVHELAGEIGDMNDPGNFNISNQRMDYHLFFDWMINGEATSYGNTFSNGVGTWTPSYDNPDLVVNYFNYEGEQSSVIQGPGMQEYIQFQAVPEPGSALLGLGGVALLLFRRHRSSTV